MATKRDFCEAAVGLKGRGKSYYVAWKLNWLRKTFGGYSLMLTTNRTLYPEFGQARGTEEQFHAYLGTDTLREWEGTTVLRVRDAFPVIERLVKRQELAGESAECLWVSIDEGFTSAALQRKSGKEVERARAVYSQTRHTKVGLLLNLQSAMGVGQFFLEQCCVCTAFYVRNRHTLQLLSDNGVPKGDLPTIGALDFYECLHYHDPGVRFYAPTFPHNRMKGRTVRLFKPLG